MRALKLGHASLATVFRPGRLTLQPILRENLESPVLRYQPITTAVVTDACLNTRWHHGAYTSAVLRESLGLDRVVTVYVELSRPDWLATVQSGRKQVQSRVCTPSFITAFSVRLLSQLGGNKDHSTKICESCLTCMLVAVRSECEFVRKFPLKYSRGQSAISSFPDSPPTQLGRDL